MKNRTLNLTPSPAVVNHLPLSLHIKTNKIEKTINWGVSEEVKQIYSQKLKRSRQKIEEDRKRRG